MERLTQASGVEKKARDLLASGKKEEAFQEFKNALQLYKLCYEKFDKNPKIIAMVRERLEELVGIAEQLKTQLEGTPAPCAPPLPPPAGSTGSTASAGSGSSAPLPGGAGGPTPLFQKPKKEAVGKAEDKEEQKMRGALAGAIMTEKPNIRWEDVAGLDAAKEALKETVILPVRYPQLFTGKRTPWHGILLYGPPGTGKSFLAKACATEADATFFSISSSDLVSKWMGESERLVRSLFDMAREQKPSIVFVDEVDSLCGERGGSGESDAGRRIKTEFLSQMDGVGKSQEGILILGATNTPWSLDAAIRRRFERRIYIPLPDVDARAEMLKLHLGDTKHAMTFQDLHQIAEQTDGFSGADLGILVRDAIFEPVRRCRRARTFKQVQQGGKLYWQPCAPAEPGAQEMKLIDISPTELLEPEVWKTDFELALERCRPSVNQKDLQAQEDFTRDYGMEG